MKTEWYLEPIQEKAIYDALNCETADPIQALLNEVYDHVAKELNVTCPKDKPLVQFIPTGGFIEEWDPGQDSPVTCYIGGTCYHKKGVVTFCPSPSQITKETVIHEFVHWHRPDLPEVQVGELTRRLIRHWKSESDSGNNLRKKQKKQGKTNNVKCIELVWFLEPSLKQLVIHEFGCTEEMQFKHLLGIMYDYVRKSVDVRFTHYERPREVHFVPLIRRSRIWNPTKKEFEEQSINGLLYYPETIYIAVQPNVGKLKPTIIREFVRWHKPELNFEEAEKLTTCLVTPS